jgi:hypothetical protein
MSRRPHCLGPLTIATRSVAALQWDDGTDQSRGARELTTETTTVSAEPASPTLAEALSSVDPFRLAVGSIVVAQAVWLGILMSRGWYYQSDFSNLAQANGHPLTWAYVTAPQGGHLGIPGRSTFWILDHTVPLNYPATIVLRLVAQFAASVMLARLLTLLVGRRPIVLGALTFYAFSPFLIQGTLWLTASIGLLGSQIFLLAALRSHIRYVFSRRFRSALAAAGFVFAAALVSEQAAVTVLIFPMLSLGFLHSGSIRNRVRGLLSCWPEWLLIATPLLAFAAYFFSVGSYSDAAKPLSLQDGVTVVRSEWTETMAPGLIGGPWRWFSTGDNYLGLAAPSRTTQTLCVIAVLLVIAGCYRIRGWPALIAWAMPAVTSGVGILVVATGRFEVLGRLIAEQFEHAFFSAVPAAIAVCVGLCAVDINDVRARAQGESRPLPSTTRPRYRRSRAYRRARPVLAIVVLTSSVISGVTYTQLWARNPARSYVTTLERSLRDAGRKVALYDTPAPSRIIPVGSTRYVSDIVGLTDAPADFGYAAARPKIVDGSGHIVVASFYRQTEVDLSAPQFCDFPVQGSAIVTKPLIVSQAKNDWHLQLTFFQQHASVLEVTLIDADGTAHTAVSGRRVVLQSRLGSVHLLFRGSAPAAIRVRGTSPATNVCITAAQIGFPFAAKKAGS